MPIRDDIESNEQVPESSLYRSLVGWAKTQPGATFIVEAETGRELTYAQTLAAVNEMRQLLGARLCLSPGEGNHPANVPRAAGTAIFLWSYRATGRASLSDDIWNDG